MSRKLLKEETVSKFMKLANISGDKRQHFLKENYIEEDLEENLEEDLQGLDEYNPLDEEALGLEEDYVEEAEEEAEDEDLEMAPEEDEDVGTVDVSADQVRKAIEAFDNLQPIIDSLRDAVEGEEPEEEEMPAPPEEEEAPLPPEEEEGEEAPLPPEEEEGEEEEGLMQEALVNKIAKRVAARLLKESKK
jgi:hypothetical protein